MTPDLRTQAGPHVFVADLESLELADDDRHHLAKSLRLRDGDPLTASDAAGSWRTIVFGHQLESTGPVHVVPDPAYRLGLGIALTKAAKPEFAVQKATELGIDSIVVFPAAHSVARWDAAKRAKNLQRLQRVAREAAMQSHRVTIPSVTIAESLMSVVEAARSELDLAPPVRADFGGVPTNSGHRFVLIGPEGGWARDEIELVPDSVDLGATVLRSETAAVAAATLLARSRDRSD